MQNIASEKNGASLPFEAMSCVHILLLMLKDSQNFIRGAILQGKGLSWNGVHSRIKTPTLSFPL